jgi:hypothetical protein
MSTVTSKRLKVCGVLTWLSGLDYGTTYTALSFCWTRNYFDIDESRIPTSSEQPLSRRMLSPVPVSISKIVQDTTPDAPLSDVFCTKNISSHEAFTTEKAVTMSASSPNSTIVSLTLSEQSALISLISRLFRNSFSHVA